MRKYRELVSVLLTVLTLTFVVSGCANNKQVNAKNQTANESTSTQSQQTPPKKAANTSNTLTSSSSSTSGNSTTNGANEQPSSGRPPAQTGTNTSSTTNPSGSANTNRSTNTSQQNLVPYHGPFQHIFFHPLIAFPSLAFSKSDPERKGFNDWFITVKEFNRVLNALYKQNYILVNINSLYTETKKNGQTFIHKKQLMLPKGKKPLVLSVDDMNYYHYMQKWGTVQRLVLDGNGKIAALSKFPDGYTSLTYNNAIVPILDSFVKKHPDFSFQGAKGMINLTGYQGVLGYRTNKTKAPNYAKTKAKAMAVITRLKKTGWTFSSHSWGHLEDAKISYQTFVADTNRWLKQVEPLTGPTQVYVYPFGSRVKTNGQKYNYLIKKGFHVLCSVGPTTYVKWTKHTLMMDRMHIDGVSLHSERKSLNILLGNAKIIDSVRPSQY